MRRGGIALGGAALLVAVTFLRLPPPRDWWPPSATPFDRTRDPGAGPVFALLTRAAARIPEGASVAVRASSGDAAQSVYCTMLAEGLLPGRRIVPAGARIAEARPEYLVVAGFDPTLDLRGKLLFRTPQGALWKLAP